MRGVAQMIWEEYVVPCVMVVDTGSRCFILMLWGFEGVLLRTEPPAAVQFMKTN
jgi:hypothetical protein